VLSLAFSPDGLTLAAGCGGSGRTSFAIRLWQISDGEPLQTFEGHSGFVNGLAFSPDGTLLVSAASDNTLRFWLGSTGTPLHTLKGHLAGINTVAFSSDGTWLVSGSSDGTIGVWGFAK
jgi:WD40 repeat protein